KNSRAMFQGSMKSRPAILGRTQAGGATFGHADSIRDWSGARVADHSRKYRIAAKSGLRRPEGTNERSLVNRKQSTWRRACADFVISIETRAEPLARFAEAESHANAQPQYMLVSSCASTTSFAPNSWLETSRPCCVTRTTKFSVLFAKSA